MLRLFAAAAAFVVLFHGGESRARDIFVNNVGGDDRNDGSAAATNSQGGGPCRTIARALRAADGGDVIILANTGEPYRESITLQGGDHSGSENFPLVIAGNGATLDGSALIPDSAWKHVRDDIFRFDPPLKSFQQVFRNDRPLVRRVSPTYDLAKLNPLEWTLHQRGIYFRTENELLPQSFDLSYAALPVGITLYEVRNVRIYDLTVQGFQLDGINCHDSVFGAVFENVVVRGNGRSGFSIGGASRVVLKECVAGDNGDAQVRTEGYSELEIVGSDLIENTAPALKRRGGKVRIRE